MRPRPTPRKGRSNIVGSEFFRQDWDVTFLPLCNKLITELVNFSLIMESKFCPLTNRLYMMAYEELGRTLVKRKFSTLNILTLGNKWIIGFGCEGHPDVNDWFGILDDVGEKIESYMNELSNHNSKRSAFIDTFGSSRVLSGKKRKREIELQKSRNAYTINASCIRHLKMLRDLQKDKGWYEKPTTCGYKFFDWRQNKSSHEKIYAFFLHTAL